MYQINTFAPLAASKEYCASKKEVFDHLTNVINSTNDFLKKEGKPAVNKKYIPDGVSIVKIDEELEPNVMSIFGKRRNISFHNIDGSKKPPKEYEDLFASEHNGVRTKKVIAK